MQIEFLLISKNQKVCSQPSASKMSEPVCRLARNANASAIETAVANKQLFNRAVSFGPQTPASRSTLPRSADRSRRSGGCGMTTKKSQACGLKSWVFGYATLHGNGVSLCLKKSKGLQVALCFKNSGHDSRFANKREMQIGSCRKQTTLQYSRFGPHKLTGQLCPTRHRSQRFQGAVE